MDDPRRSSTRGVVGPELAAGLAHAALALARRFAGGATLWCVAPSWPEHARHVAVEFVHPVIMGKRALPAVSVVGEDPVDSLRACARSGDVVLAVSSAEDPRVRSVMRRAGAWGATTVWVGSGARPEAGGADHVLWLEDAGGDPVRDGGLVLLYHLLWELTHVCFEHPGLLRANGPEDCRWEPGCVTCSDEGRLAEVAVPGPGPGSATVRTADGMETVDTTLVGPVRGGDLLLVHAGLVITVVEQADADA